MHQASHTRTAGRHKLIRLSGLVIALALVVLAALPLFCADAASELSGAEWVEATRLRLNARNINFQNRTQQRLVTTELGTSLVAVTVQGTHKAQTDIDNLFYVFLPDAAVNKRVTLFGGVLNSGSAELLAGSDGALYVVGGSSSWVYYGKGGTETAIGEFCRYDAARNMMQKVRTAFQFPFGEGSGYTFRKACLDEAGGRCCLFYTSEDGEYLSWLTYDLREREWTEIHTVKTSLRVGELYAFVRDGRFLLAAQPLEADGSFLLVSIEGPDAVTQQTQDTGRPVDIVAQGDAFLTSDGKLHVLAGAADGSSVLHYLYADALTPAADPETLALGGNELQMAEMADGSLAVFAASVEEAACTVRAYLADGGSFGSLTEAASFAARTSRAIAAGSFMISAPAGSPRTAGEFGFLYNGSDYTYLQLKLAK